MHELSIALAMIEQIEPAVKSQAGTISAVHARIGALSGVDAEALRFAWEIARAGTALEHAELQIEKVPLVVRCSACGVEREADVWAIACPACITPEQGIVSGKELEVVAMEVA